MHTCGWELRAEQSLAKVKASLAYIWREALERIFWQVWEAGGKQRAHLFHLAQWTSWPEGSRVAPRKVSSNFCRGGWRTRGLNWPLAGQAPGGAGAQGPWRVGRGRMEPRVGAPPAALPPGGAPSCGSEVVLPQAGPQGGRAGGGPPCPATDHSVTQGGWGHQWHTSSHPVSASGAGTPPDVPYSIPDVYFLTPSATREVYSASLSPTSLGQDFHTLWSPKEPLLGM